jgi:hypothetical protein
MLEISGAPGCYGMGTLFKAESNECSTCPFGATCGPKAALQLERIRAEMGIVVKVAPPKRLVKNPTVSPTALALNLPKKVAELMTRIDAAGIKVTEALAQGLNPFTTRPSFLRVTCHLLLKLPMGISRDLLCTCFMSKLNWSKGTADAHVIQAVQYLKAVGAANEVDGSLRLRNFQ